MDLGPPLPPTLPGGTAWSWVAQPWTRCGPCPPCLGWSSSLCSLECHHVALGAFSAPTWSGRAHLRWDEVCSPSGAWLGPSLFLSPQLWLRDPRLQLTHSVFFLFASFFSPFFPSPPSLLHFHHQNSHLVATDPLDQAVASSLPSLPPLLFGQAGHKRSALSSSDLPQPGLGWQDACLCPVQPVWLPTQGPG